MKYFLIGTMLLTGTSLALAQSVTNPSGQTNGSGQLTTLVVSPNANGLGVRVVDQAGGSGGQQVASTNGADDEGELDEQVVGGLIEWLEKKKKEKKERKEKKKKEKEEEKQKEKEKEKPPREAPERKEIHIHIHIRNKEQGNHQHKKPDHHKHHKPGGHYEDYHEGHFDHDKHYQGKHSWPLLGHHFNWDHDFMGGFGNVGGGGGFGDDYGGYESKKINNYVVEKKPIIVQRPVLVKKGDN